LSLRVAFTKWTDLWHLVLGVIAGVLVRFPMGWVISFAITISYIVYQAVEVEEPLESYADYVEYLVGVFVGLILALAKL